MAKVVVQLSGRPVVARIEGPDNLLKDWLRVSNSIVITREIVATAGLEMNMISLCTKEILVLFKFVSFCVSCSRKNYFCYFLNICHSWAVLQSTEVQKCMNNWFGIFAVRAVVPSSS